MSTQVADRPQAAAIPSAVEGVLNFAERGPEKAYTYTYKPPEGTPATNIKTYAQTVTLENARQLAGGLDVDVQGFQIVSHRTAVRDFWDEAQTMALGHPEVAELVKAVTGASRVVVYDHTLRRRDVGVADRTPGQARQPAGRVHIDQTVDSGPQRVRDLMGEQAEALLKHRAAIINVWRPIHHEARDWPLAFADARSVARDDLIASDLIFPHRKGEIYGVSYNPAQRWRFVPDLQVDEAILIKCWDSDPSVAQFTPHTAFQDPTTPEGTPPRESIEFRTIAFFD
ncbi:MAG TPA: CmcJ/NvfI family oxidoreductase [Caulobacteraceae bacterium]|nr:CmcJ/NvfI family oxidoreductase [Caulobacteraceae bacterium]